MRRWWQTWWQGGEAVNLSKEGTSGNSKRRLEIHLGVERRAAQRDEGIGEEVKTWVGEPGEELLKTLWLATPRRRL